MSKDGLSVRGAWQVGRVASGSIEGGKSKAPAACHLACQPGQPRRTLSVCLFGLQGCWGTARLLQVSPACAKTRLVVPGLATWPPAVRWCLPWLRPWRCSRTVIFEVWQVAQIGCVRFLEHQLLLLELSITLSASLSITCTFILSGG